MIARGETSGSRLFRKLRTKSAPSRLCPSPAGISNSSFLIQTFHVWLPSLRRFAARTDYLFSAVCYAIIRLQKRPLRFGGFVSRSLKIIVMLKRLSEAISRSNIQSNPLASDIHCSHHSSCNFQANPLSDPETGGFPCANNLTGGRHSSRN